MKNSIFTLPLFLINMKKEGKRRKNTLSLLTKLGFTNIFIIEPINLKESSKHPIGKYTKNLNKTSHILTFLSIIKQNKNKYFIIIEDDIILNNIMVNEAKKKLDYIWKQALLNRFDLLYLEYCNSSCFKHKKLNTYLSELSSPFCSAFIVFSPQSSKVILNDFKNKSIKDLVNPILIPIIKPKYRFGIDEYFAFKINKKELKALGYPIFKQDPTITSSLPGSLRDPKPNFIYKLFLDNNDQCCIEIFILKIIVKILILMFLILMIVYFIYRLYK